MEEKKYIVALMGIISGIISVTTDYLGFRGVGVGVDFSAITKSYTILSTYGLRVIVTLLLIAGISAIIGILGLAHYIYQVYKKCDCKPVASLISNIIGAICVSIVLGLIYGSLPYKYHAYVYVGEAIVFHYLAFIFTLTLFYIKSDERAPEIQLTQVI